MNAIHRRAVLFWLGVLLLNLVFGGISIAGVSGNFDDPDNPAEASQDSDGTSAEANDWQQTTVGFPKLIFQHVIPGPKIVALPIVQRGQKAVVRIVDTYPHGEDFRYDIEYIGLEPGPHNIADYLVREDGSSQPIPAINVQVDAILDADKVLPFDPEPQRSRFYSFYVLSLIGGGLLWVAGLFAILLYGRKKSTKSIPAKRQQTVADRMRPLIDLAIAGKLDVQQQAELERVLSGFWSKKLRLEDLPANELRDRLREHEQASVLLNQIDYWLHRPESDRAEQININELLEPYQSAAQESLP